MEWRYDKDNIIIFSKIFIYLCTHNIYNYKIKNKINKYKYIYILNVIPFYKSAKYRSMMFISPIPCSFISTPPLPSNPIYHQLSQRECLFISCMFR